MLYLLLNLLVSFLLVWRFLVALDGPGVAAFRRDLWSTSRKLKNDAFGLTVTGLFDDTAVKKRGRFVKAYAKIILINFL